MTTSDAHGATPDPAAVTELSTSQCWELLEAHRLGRLALVDVAGEPQIYPVNYASSEGVLYIRTANDSKLRHLRARPVVAMEIDGVDGDERWSVVVRGEATQVQTDDEIRRSRATGLRSMSPTAKPFVIRLQPGAVTGRRFRETSDPAQDSTMQVQRIEPEPDVLPPSARRPNAISHFPPLPEE